MNIYEYVHACLPYINYIVLMAGIYSFLKHNLFSLFFWGGVVLLFCFLFVMLPKLPGSNDPPAQVPRVSETRHLHHSTRLIPLYKEFHSSFFIAEHGIKV